MLSFKEIIIEKNITQEADVEDIAQAAIQTYYWKPYPNKEDFYPREVNRKFHGALHVCSAKFNLEMQFAFYQKYFPHLFVQPDGSPFDEELIKLLMLAVIYHDWANTGEIFHDEKAQAKGFKLDMQELGFDKAKIVLIAKAMSEKDSEQDTNIFRDFIHDSDCFDIIRMLEEKKDFRKSELRLFKHILTLGDKNKNKALLELDQMVENHFETYHLIQKSTDSEKSNPLHLRCEYAVNCCRELRFIEQKILQDYIIIECLKQGKQISVADIDLSSLTILDLYNRKNSPHVKKIIDGLSKKTSDEKILPLDLKETHLIRALINVDNEASQLEINQKSLKEAKINTTEEFKFYIQLNKKSPDNFKWRPCSMIRKGLTFSLFAGEEIAVIIDPSSLKGTLLPYLYKKNAYSALVASSCFEYERKKGPYKNKKSLEQLTLKMLEEDKRRKGIMVDIGLHYFGKPNLPYTEILCSYSLQGVAGIVVPFHNPDIAIKAILFAARFKPIVPFYRYDSIKGFTPTIIEDIIHQACILRPRTSICDHLLQSINDKIGSLLSLSDYKKTEIDEYTNETTSRFVTINLSQIDDDLKKAIRSICKNFKINNKDNAYNSPSSLLTKIEITENSENILTIQVQIINFYSKEQDQICLDNFVNQLLEPIYQRILTGKSQNLGNHIEIQELKFIICPTRQQDNGEISSTNPLRFEFQHPTRPDTRCVARVNEGIPIIEFYEQDEKKPFISSTTQLVDIALQYYVQKTNELNAFISSHQSTLNKLGFKNLQFNLLPHKNEDKYYVSITIDSDSGNTERDLATLLKIPDVNKIKREQKQNQVKLESPYVQDIDLYQTFLNQAIKNTYKSTVNPINKGLIETPYDNKEVNATHLSKYNLFKENIAISMWEFLKQISITCIGLGISFSDFTESLRDDKNQRYKKINKP